MPTLCVFQSNLVHGLKCLILAVNQSAAKNASSTRYVDPFLEMMAAFMIAACEYKYSTNDVGTLNKLCNSEGSFLMLRPILSDNWHESKYIGSSRFLMDHENQGNSS